MNHADWSILFRNTINEIERLSVQKGGEYASGGDRLENFKHNAASLGLRPEQVWAVYAGKHWDAIQTYVKDISSNRLRERSESIEGRLDDLIVYCILMKAIIQEQNVQPGTQIKDEGGIETPHFLLKDSLPHVLDYNSRGFDTGSGDQK